MKKQIIKTTGIIGIIGATLMFVGDMLLYFTTEKNAHFGDDFLPILTTISQTRLIIGGLIGPFASFLYAIGFYQIYLAIKPSSKNMSKIIFILLSIGIIYGGSFHSFFPHLAFMSLTDNQEALKLAEVYSLSVIYIMILFSLVGQLILTYLILTKKTYYPRWIILLSPIVLLWFSVLIELLPHPYGIIASSSWGNMVFIIFFSISTITLLKKNYE